MPTVSPAPLAQVRPPPLQRRQRRARFRFGPWLVDPVANTIDNGAQQRQLEPRTMDVLVALCAADGAVLSADELLEQCWGNSIQGDSPLHKNIAHLRRLLGDDANAPRFIETIRKRGYRAVAELDFTTADAAARQWEQGSPFRGLLAFDEAHAQVFYGREEATRKLVKAARAQIDHGLALLLVLGPSGSGKTSVVQAGLLPAMNAALQGPGPAAILAAVTFDIADQGEQTLFCALAGSLLDLQWGDTWVFENDNAVALARRLEHDCADVVAQLRAPLAQRPPAMRFALFIDRFEALFNASRVTEAERTAFLSTLEQLARGACCLVVLACRNDFYPNIARYRLLIDCKANGGHVDLAPPSFSDIAQMIRKPAAAARLSFGIDPATHASLDDVLCESAAASPDSLPLLQYCLHELYRLRSPDGELSFDALRELGGLEGTIGQRAEQVVLELSAPQRATLAHIMSLVTVLSVDNEQVTSQRAPWSALHNEEARQVVRRLIEARLFITDLVSATPVFGIAHEAILRRWPRMSEWIASHRDALRARSRLGQQTARWSAEGKPPDLLIPRGKPLDEARQLQADGLWSLTALEAELVRLSARQARRAEWLRMAALGVIMGLGVLVLVLFLEANRARQAAETRRSEVEGLVDYMLGEFADHLRPLGKLDLLDSVSGKALEYLRGSPDQALSPSATTLRAKALQVIGEVSRSRGNSTQAIDALNQANVILMRQHRADPRNVQVLDNLGNNAYWVGQLHKDHNNMQGAATAWRAYLQFADQLHALEPDRVAWWVEQSYAHNNLGSLAYGNGHPSVAAGEFSASIALKERALAAAGASKMLTAELAESLSWLATARQSEGQLDLAEQIYQRALSLARRQRAQFSGEPLWVNREVRLLQNHAVLLLATGDDARALADLERARVLFAEVTQHDPGNYQWQVELANLELDLLKVKARSSAGALLLPELGRVHATLLAMVERSPQNAPWARSEAVARGRIAAVLLGSGELDAASRDIGASVQSLRRLHAANPASIPLRLALVESLLIATAVHAADQQPDLAAADCRQAAALLPTDPATMDFQILDPWARATLCAPNSTSLPWHRLQQIGYRDALYRRLSPPASPPARPPLQGK
ncbi:hypothetical protein Jab_2c13970 [Janthinobacterium sp. HH01]|uniref:nSTAND1 domain-containing NTPase n=1 Tax=Janthinobacterium sp. HH01 TaxID=1198452 RepID=UPI0002AE8C8E|nr:winged helix-turn-helix domain-containing protein [Janthinobacterium sp. HH01]ELX09331.1 hypothetical protein Jab_2c13970 [Janthinobacterium sp. HH01]